VLSFVVAVLLTPHIVAHVRSKSRNFTHGQVLLHIKQCFQYLTKKIFLTSLNVGELQISVMNLSAFVWYSSRLLMV
jgi:hypothetical protein